MKKQFWNPPETFAWLHRDLLLKKQKNGNSDYVSISSSSSSSLFLFSSHIKQLTNTKNKFTLMKVNGDVDAIKERKACD